MSIDLQTNPLREGLPREKAVGPCVFVIFGGTGDLAHRKLLPALYHLYLSRLLPRNFAVVCYASTEFTDEQYRESVLESMRSAKPPVPVEGPSWEGFQGLLRYVSRSRGDGQSLKKLKERLNKVNAEVGGGGNYLFYLAIPPQAFADTAVGLSEIGLAQDPRGEGWRRLVVEKPFGTDLDSARELNAKLQSIFREDQIYRIDHYLGKETVQNILVFRFANEFVEPLLSSQYVDHIQITVAESIGVEQRGAFYDATGALRDIVQNHMMQVMALVCMEPPSSLDPEAVRDERTKVLRSVRLVGPEQVGEMAVRGQYTSGMLMGKHVPAYREERDVPPDSMTETYAALKLFVDNWRWDGVPIYLRTGKRLAKRVTEVAIRLKNVPRVLFGEEHSGGIRPNIIALTIQPDDGISLRFQAREPGLSRHLRPVRMDFRYSTAFGSTAPDAYERLILDALLGDPSLYARADMVELAWQVCDPILQTWQAGEAPLYFYTPGSWGPKEADDLIARGGRKWRRL